MQSTLPGSRGESTWSAEMGAHSTPSIKSVHAREGDIDGGYGSLRGSCLFSVCTQIMQSSVDQNDDDLRKGAVMARFSRFLYAT